MKKIKKKLITSELEKELLQKIVTDASDCIYLLDEYGNVVFCSTTFAERLGYTHEEAMSLNVRDWNASYSDEEIVDKIKKLKKSPGFFETKHIKKNGTIIDVEVNARAIQLQGEYYLYASSRDITEKLKKIKVESHLARLASIGELAGGIGHEINNPLTIIKGYLDSIKKRTDPKQEIVEVPIATLEKMEQAIERIVKITKDLRTYTRNNAKVEELFNPPQAILETLDLVKEFYKKDNIVIKTEFDKDSENIMIKADRGNFHQVIMNLLSNARDAVEDVDRKRIYIRCKLEDDQLQIIVADNGVGFTPAVKENIFTPFFTTKDVSKGTGIGLSLVSNFIREMKGTIEAESDPGKETTFKIAIPPAQLKGFQQTFT